MPRSISTRRWPSSNRWRRLLLLRMPVRARARTGTSMSANILRGEHLHKSITELAMKLVVSGMGGRAAGNHLRALMAQSQAPRDERYQNRFDYIPRAVGSARKKLADQAQAAQQAARIAAAPVPALPLSGNGAAQPASGGAGAGMPPPPSFLQGGVAAGPDTAARSVGARSDYPDRRGRASAGSG